MSMQFRRPFATLSIAGATLALSVFAAGCGGPSEGTSADDGVAATTEALPFNPGHLYLWAWNKNWDLPAAGIHFAPNLQTGPIYGSFGVSQSGAGAAEMFWRDETLSIKHLTPSGSGGWNYESLGGTDFGGVGVGRAPNGSMEVVAGVTRKGDTQVYVTQGATRSGWLDIGGVSSQTAPAVVLPDGIPHVFVVGTDGNLWQHEGMGTRDIDWSVYPWEQIPAIPGRHKIVSSPTATARGANVNSKDADLVVQADDGKLWHLNYHVQSGFLTEDGVSTWEPLPFAGLHAPYALTSNSSTSLTLFATTDTHGVEMFTWNSGRWIGGDSISGCYTGPIQATTSANGTINVWIAQLDGNVYHNAYSTHPVNVAGPNVCDGYCGSSGMACCGDNTCSAIGGVNAYDPATGTSSYEPLSCQQGKCGTCGGAGMACCPGDTCVAPGTTCNAANQCSVSTPTPAPTSNPTPPQPKPSCGGLGQTCCENTTCGSKFLACVPGAFGGTACVACGGLGEVCCANATCYRSDETPDDALPECGNFNPGPANKNPGTCELLTLGG